ncbi:MAG: hypothetical protein QXF79_04525 [Ignisphaera sp.]
MSCLNDDRVAIKGRRIYLPIEADPMMPADVAPNNLVIGGQVLREKPMPITHVIQKYLNKQHG